MAAPAEDVHEEEEVQNDFDWEVVIDEAVDQGESGSREKFYDAEDEIQEPAAVVEEVLAVVAQASAQQKEIKAAGVDPSGPSGSPLTRSILLRRRPPPPSPSTTSSSISISGDNELCSSIRHRRATPSSAIDDELLHLHLQRRQIYDEKNKFEEKFEALPAEEEYGTIKEGEDSIEETHRIWHPSNLDSYQAMEDQVMEDQAMEGRSNINTFLDSYQAMDETVDLEKNTNCVSKAALAQRERREREKSAKQAQIQKERHGNTDQQESNDFYVSKAALAQRERREREKLAKQAQTEQDRHGYTDQQEHDKARET
ncbi:hypothetical protein Dimus_017951, partial [Dionaea muscipula]